MFPGVDLHCTGPEQHLTTLIAGYDLDDLDDISVDDLHDLFIDDPNCLSVGDSSTRCNVFSPRPPA